MRWASTACVLALAACAGAPPPSCGGADQASATMQAIIAADNARDLASVMGLYTEDVVWRPPGRAPIVGAAEIRESYVHMYGVYNPSLSIAVERARIEDGRAHLAGRTSGVLRPQMTEVPDAYVNDRFEAVLACARGGWRVAELAWAPAADAP